MGSERWTERRTHAPTTVRCPLSARPYLLFAALLVAVTCLAAVLRLAALDTRTMHADEAAQAVGVLGPLLEEGEYRYQRREYHGPSLVYFTLPVARLASATNLTEIGETELRLVPAVFGTLLVVLVWPLRHALGGAATLWAALLTAVSPAMVFYSRYCIQETFLVFFSFGAIVALWRFWREISSSRDGGRKDGPKTGDRKSQALRASSLQPPASSLPSPSTVHCPPSLWLVLLGICLGMMHASKETCVIPIFALAVAAALTLGELRRMGTKRLALSSLVVMFTAASVSALFFSSFLKNPHGVVDSYTTYAHYLRQALGEGGAGPHRHDWSYYLRILFWWQRGDGPFWTEAAIAVPAVAALAAAITGRWLEGTSLCLVRLLAVYTLILTVIYCAIPYKTPWCALGPLHGMIVLAGIGATVLIRAAPGNALKTATVVGLVLATVHLAWQAHRASFAACEDPNNPYVYAQATRDVPQLARRLEQIAARHPDGRGVHIQVVCPNDDFWPLPWYFRGFSRVGWFDRVPSGPAAPLIVSHAQMEPFLLEYLYEDQPPGQRHLYLPLPADPDGPAGGWQLRPHVPLRVYVRSDLWAAYEEGGQWTVDGGR